MMNNDVADHVVSALADATEEQLLDELATRSDAFVYARDRLSRHQIPNTTNTDFYCTRHGPWLTALGIVRFLGRAYEMELNGEAAKALMQAGGQNDLDPPSDGA